MDKRLMADSFGVFSGGSPGVGEMCAMHLSRVPFLELYQPQEPVPKRSPSCY